MENRIITISRQYGSGGRQIGQALAKRLDIPFYDSAIIALAAKESGFAADCFEQAEKNGSYLVRDYATSMSVPLSLLDKVYLAQYSAIKALAQKGPCVIVGRGAGAVLQGQAELLNVFVYADLQTRKRRAIDEYGDNAHKIEEHIAAIDKKRAAYFKFYTDVNGGRMESYHLCIDSGYIGLQNAVTLIETAYLLHAPIAKA